MISTKLVDERFSASALVNELRMPDTSMTSTSAAASCAYTGAARFNAEADNTAKVILESL